MVSKTGLSASARSGILLVEDDDIHAMLTEKALRKAGFDARLWRAADGEEALEALLGKGKFGGRDRLGLVLLDLKIPKVAALDVLRAARQFPETAQVVIVMLTTSDDPHDCEEALRLGANSYVTKPGDPREFRDTVGQIFLRWFKDGPVAAVGEAR